MVLKREHLIPANFGFFTPCPPSFLRGQEMGSRGQKKDLEFAFYSKFWCTRESQGAGDWGRPRKEKTPICERVTAISCAWRLFPLLLPFPHIDFCPFLCPPEWFLCFQKQRWRVQEILSALSLARKITLNWRLMFCHLTACHATIRAKRTSA